MIVKSSLGPTHSTPPFSKVGVTVIVAIIGSIPVLTAVKSISPIPESPAPISKSDDQSYVVVPPVFSVVNPTVVVSPLQTI